MPLSSSGIYGIVICGRGVVICGRPLLRKGEVGFEVTICRGAVICPACLRGADGRWP
jgi:hypothetical protein